MGENGEKQVGQVKVRKLCGFTRKVCLEGECVMWATIMMINPQLGTPMPTSMCVFNATLLVAGSPKPQMAPMPGPKINLGNLKVR